MTVNFNAVVVCAPSSFTNPSASDLTYNINTGSSTFTIPAYTQNNGCTYTETLTISPNNISWLSLSGRTVSITETNTASHGTSQQFTVTSTLNDGAATSNSNYVFTVTLSDPCRSATIATPSLSTMTLD